MSNKQQFMIGNDIVCYSEISNKERFFLKITQANERNLLTAIIGNTNKNAILFSIKEAAYKSIVKHHLNAAFSAARFCIQKFESIDNTKEINTFTGIIKYLSHHIYFKTMLADKYVHTISWMNVQMPDDIETAINLYPKLTPANQSNIAKQQVISGIQKYLNLTATVIKDKKGIPYTVAENQNLNTDISISHDGQYIATVIRYNLNKQKYDSTCN